MATEITMVIPLTVVFLPFLDVWITGPEKDLSKRPLIFMVALMGLINWLAFSGLIVANIANIHADPPYWRDFLWLMVDFGVLMQLAVYTMVKEPVAKARLATGALTMGIVMLVQSLVAFVYYYMALTEMFLSPLTQAWTYGFCRLFMANNSQIESAVATLSNAKSAPPFWFYRDLLARNGDVPEKALMVQLKTLVDQSGSMLDGIFRLIPTFQVDTSVVLKRMAENGVDPAKLNAVLKSPWEYPKLHLDDIPQMAYQNMADFMVTNRWVFDYNTFMERMAGHVKPYPIEVPPLDWGWMAAGPICAIACFYFYFQYKALAPAKPAAVAKTPTAT